ncbi:putative methyltransferase C9orf114 isoform X1 [Ptychodera flava]|uniref:putative methyltransferase C9orf114 isoform X1 n=1 Tax=Ptychodera flava TaxID=63121 RepID=UPI00396A76FF
MESSTTPNSQSITRPSEGSPSSKWREWKQEMKKRKSAQTEALLAKKQKKAEKAKVAAEEAEKLESEEQELKANLGRPWTISIALPGSILDNAQSPELRTYLAGQIARACVVFNVDEIIIFDESGTTKQSTEGVFEGIGKKGNANVQLARILQYLECPQYLRKSFFPKHSDLQYAGVLNPLDCPHHMRTDDESEFREGVVLNRPAKEGKGSFVNAGMRKEVRIDRQLQAGIRVTVKLNDKGKQTGNEKKFFTGTVVGPTVPRTDRGLYWGYTVRLAPTLGTVFTKCPYKGGYDLTIGTSDRGENADEVPLPKFSHLLVVFGGLKGLEYSLECDERLKVNEVEHLFDMYLNTCSGQGSRTIRTEATILITMATLRPKIKETFWS